MVQVLSRRYQETREADPETMDERDKIVANRVIYTLPIVNDLGYLNWDKVSYKLPQGREKEEKESRKALLKFLDSTNTGRMSIDDLKNGFARIVTMPGIEDP